MTGVAGVSAAIFCASAGAVTYAYAIYPAIIYGLSRCFGRQPSSPEIEDASLPVLSLLIAAHNEESVIAERIEDALRLDYPHDRLEIVIASDGSDDRTVEIVQRYTGVRLLDFERQGKAATLNAAMQFVRGEIVMLSDANTAFAPTAAKRLVRWFADPTTVAVCGRLVLIDPESGKNVDGLYWRYETFLKKCEARLDALLGANGAIYAIRHDAFVPLPPQTIVDDFVIPLAAKLRHGGSIIYDSDAIGEEETAGSVREEFRRRTRIGAGGFHAIGQLWRLLDPRRGWIAFTFLSHKVMRWLCPFFMLAALCSAGVLAMTSDVRWPLFVQLAFYLMAGAAMLMPTASPIARRLRLTSMFVSMNAALFCGFIRWARGKQRGTWQRTARATSVRQAA